MEKSKRSVFGVGINDADYPISQLVDGESKLCPFYVVWKNMLKRCYCQAYKKKRPSYDGCLVVPEWHYFMTFRSWMIKQDWKGNQLDKDLLIEGNKVYGPNTCMFLSERVNKFLTDCFAVQGDYPTGVYYDKKAGKFRAQCNRLGSGKKYLGLFDCPTEAQKAYLKEKASQAVELAYQQTEGRVINALLNKYTLNQVSIESVPYSVRMH